MIAKAIKDILKAGNFLSAENIEKIVDGTDFRIQDYRFDCRQIDDSSWEYISSDGQLMNRLTVRNEEANVVVSCELCAIGTIRTLPIHVLEPLHLEFEQSCVNWRQIHFAGGTAEGVYPPVAFRKSDIAFGRGVKIESHPGGRSSNLHLPLLMSLFSEADDSEGLYCGLEWSGLWYMDFRPEEDDRSSLSIGIKVNGLILEPGETLRLPDVHLGFFKGGPSEGGNALRSYIHDHISAKYMKQPVIPAVSYNQWPSKFDFNFLKEQAEMASKIGTEVYVVDAGWFPGEFPLGVGNWDRTDEKKLPDGLEPLAACVRDLGMEFGLWFEPERAAENTTLHKRHPDWFYPGGEGRNFHLDLANPSARKYLIEMLGGYIERLDLRWIKWDYNISPFKHWEAADATLKIQFEYIYGLYHVLDTLMENYPLCRMEHCASGGRRIDLGIIRRSHVLFLSDAYHFRHNPLLSRYFQARANCFLPGHLLSSWVSAQKEEDSMVDNDTAVLSRMLGHIGFNADIAGWSESQSETAAFWVKAYKQVRHLVAQRFYQLLPTPSSIEDWDAVQSSALKMQDELQRACSIQPGSAVKVNVVIEGDGSVRRATPGAGVGAAVCAASALGAKQLKRRGAGPVSVELGWKW